jgi:hypothetical protein
MMNMLTSLARAISIILFIIMLPSIAWAHTNLAVVSSFSLTVLAQLIMLSYLFISTKFTGKRFQSIGIYCTSVLTSWTWFLSGSGALYAAIAVLFIPPLISFFLLVSLFSKR